MKKHVYLSKCVLIFMSMYHYTHTQYAELKRHAKYLIHRSIILVMTYFFTREVEFTKPDAIKLRADYNNSFPKNSE